MSLVAAVAISPSATAQTGDPKGHAQELFRLGREQAQKGNCLAAMPLFEASYERFPANGPLYNLALCEESVGRLPAAWTHFQELQELLPTDDERAPDVRTRMARLETRIARLQVDLAVGVPAGATVRLDGTRLRSDHLETEIPLDPGEHSIVLDAPGQGEKEHRVTLEAGNRRTVTLVADEPVVQRARVTKLVPAPVPPATRGPEPGSTGLPLAYGLAAVGVGLTGITVGGITGAMALDKAGELRAGCPQVKGCPADLEHLAHDARSLGAASNVAFIVGGVGLATGAVLFLVGRAAGQKETAQSSAQVVVGLGSIQANLRFR